MNSEEPKDTKKVVKILVLDKDKVLLLLSSTLNKFHLPGGHVMEGETFEHAIERELKEETTLTLNRKTIIFKNSRFALYKGFSFGTVKLSDEHTDFVWAPIESAHLLDLCDFTRRDILKLQKVWNKNKKKPVETSK